jgi:hypothetical protein
MNSKIGVQGAMLVDTNKTIEGERGRMSLPIRTLNALKREKFPLL